MSGPWEAYAQQEAPSGPWQNYAPQEAPQTATQRALAALGYVDNLARQFAGGATFGFADEGAAGARALTEGVPYNEALQQERDRDTAFRRDNPIAATAAQVAGAVVSPAGRLLPMARGQSASLPGAVGRGAVVGASGGALGGFGEGEGGLGQRLMTAAIGGGLGLGVGAAVPAALAAGSAAWRAGSRAMGYGTPRADAERIALRELARDGVTPEELVQRSAEAGAAGRPMMLADLGGENLQQTAQVVARTPGQGRQIAAEAIQGRGGERQAVRLADDVRALVSGDDFTATMQDIARRRAAAAAPNYDRAYAVQLPEDPRLQRFLNDPDIREGIRRGLVDARREAIALDRPFDPAAFGVRIRPDGGFDLIGGSTPTQLFDAAQRGLREIAEGARGPNGQATDASRRVGQLREALLARLDELNPDFRAARAAYAGESALLDAARRGSELLDMRPADWREFAPAVARMSGSEREALRMGLARNMLDRIENTTDAQELTRLNRLMMTSAFRERIRATFDNDAETGRFLQAFMQEAQMARTNQNIAPRGGSPTMPMQERAADLRNVPPGPVSGAVVNPELAPGVPLGTALLQAGTQGGLTAPLFATGQRVGQAFRENAYRQNMQQLAPMLFNTDPRARQQYAENLLVRAMRDAELRNAIAPFARAATRGLPVAASLEAN